MDVIHVLIQKSTDHNHLISGFAVDVQLQILSHHSAISRHRAKFPSMLFFCQFSCEGVCVCVCVCEERNVCVHVSAPVFIAVYLFKMLPVQKDVSGFINTQSLSHCRT